VATLVIRDTLQDDSYATFEEAVSHLANSPIPAPIYIIIASGQELGKGAVITRDRSGAADIWELNVAKGRWFEVETNFDHWEPDKDGRRTTAEQVMNKIGQRDISLDGIFRVLSTPNVLNQKTTYSTLMDPTTGNYTTFIRNL